MNPPGPQPISKRPRPPIPRPAIPPAASGRALLYLSVGVFASLGIASFIGLGWWVIQQLGPPDSPNVETAVVLSDDVPPLAEAGQEKDSESEPNPSPHPFAQSEQDAQNPFAGGEEPAEPEWEKSKPKDGKSAEAASAEQGEDRKIDDPPGPDADKPPANDAQRLGNEQGAARPRDDPPEVNPPDPNVVDAFTEILKRDRHIGLPELLSNSLVGGGRKVEIAKLLVDSVSDCTLELLGKEIAFGDQTAVTLVPQEHPDGSKTWTVVVQQEAFGNRKSELAEFSLHNQSLAFSWNRNAGGNPAAQRLKFCLLEISVTGRKERCILGGPQEVTSEPIDLLQKSQISFGVKAQELPAPEHLRLDLSFKRIPKHETDPQVGLEVSDESVTKIPSPSGDAEAPPLLEVVARFDCDEDPCLPLVTYGYFEDEFEAVVRQEVKSRSLSKARKDHEKERKRLDIEKRRLEPMQVSAERAVAQANAQAQRAPTLDDKHRLEAYADSLKQKRKEIKEDLDRLADACRKIDRSESMQMQMREACKSIKQSGELHCRLYIVVEGVQIEIVRLKAASAR